MFDGHRFARPTARRRSQSSAIPIGTPKIRRPWRSHPVLILLVTALLTSTIGLATIAPTATANPKHGVSPFINCQTPTPVGSPYECSYGIQNTDGYQDGTTITDIDDVIQTSSGPVDSGNILGSLQLIFNPGIANPSAMPSCTGGSGLGTSASPYVGATFCTIPWDAAIQTNDYSFYTVAPADLLSSPLNDIVTFTWQSLCSSESGINCPIGSQLAQIGGSTVVQPPPTVTAASPNSGPYVGGNTVVITGSGFTGATAVDFFGGGGPIPPRQTDLSPSFTVDSDTQITAVAPFGAVTSYGGSFEANIEVTTPAGTNSATTADEYTFTTSPSITTPDVAGVSPDSGPYTGGTTTIITGNGLTAATSVEFGSVPAASFIVQSDTQIMAVTPAGAANTLVDITITNAAGTSAKSPFDHFVYTSATGFASPSVTDASPNSGPYVGGNTVVITGRGFTGATAVDFFGGGGPIPPRQTDLSPSFTVDSDTQITAVAPFGAVTSYGGSFEANIEVTTPAGTNSATTADEYTFTTSPSITQPNVTGVSPDSGPIPGGNTVIITGKGLTAATVVDFGSIPATTFATQADTQIMAVAPAGQGGNVVDVRVANSAGTSRTLTADRYSYLHNPIAKVNPRKLDFGVTSVGVGNEQSAFLLDEGPSHSSDLDISSVTVGGVDPSDFSIVTDNCSGHSLLSFGSCSVVVSFIPTTTGVRTAQLDFFDNGGLQTVALKGTGNSAEWGSSIEPTPNNAEVDWTTVSCSSKTFCLALGENGNGFTSDESVTWNGTVWQDPLQIDSPGAGLSGVSCVSPTFCIAVGSGGVAYTFNGGSWNGPEQVDPSQYVLNDVSCASTSFCVAVGIGGAYTYNGSSWRSSDNSVGGDSVSCVSISFCMTANASSTYTYNGTGWSGAMSVTTQGGPLGPDPVSCTSRTFCMGLGNVGNAYTWNTSSWNNSPTNVGSIWAATSVSCVSSSFCVAVGPSVGLGCGLDLCGPDYAYIWTGGSWETPIQLDSSSFEPSVSCVSRSFCVAVDQNDSYIYQVPSG